MNLIQSYRERDENYCVNIHLNHQFSMCITSPYQKRNSMWYSEVVGNIIHYIQSWTGNIVLEYIFRLAICAYLPPVLFWCVQVLLIWISECTFSNYRWTKYHLQVLSVLNWIVVKSAAFSESKKFEFIFTAQQSVHVDSNDSVAALTAFGLPGMYWAYFLTIQVNPLLNIDPETNTTYTSTSTLCLSSQKVCQHSIPSACNKWNLSSSQFAV